MGENVVTSEDTAETGDADTALVVERLVSGSARSRIVRKLCKRGMEYEQAVSFVKSVFSDLVRIRRDEQCTTGVWMVTLIAAVVAALAAACIWGLVILSAQGHGTGPMALAVGVAAGMAVPAFSRGKQGIQLQGAALFATLPGILAGKYFTYFCTVACPGASPEAPVEWARLTSFSTISSFFPNILSVVGYWDILWVALALIFAWRLSRGWGIRLTSEHIPSVSDLLIAPQVPRPEEAEKTAKYAEGWGVQQIDRELIEERARHNRERAEEERKKAQGKSDNAGDLQLL